jgi:hypothetical protein
MPLHPTESAVRIDYENPNDNGILGYLIVPYEIEETEEDVNFIGGIVVNLDGVEEFGQIDPEWKKKVLTLSRGGGPGSWELENAILENEQKTKEQWEAQREDAAEGHREEERMRDEERAYLDAKDSYEQNEIDRRRGH